MPFTASRPGAPLVHWHVGGSGEPLLLLNGWTASGIVWPTAWLSRLEQRFCVFRIDNRGSGWSRSAPTPFSIADLAHDARSVLTACGVSTATVLGFSMGGMVAQELAIRHPEQVARLVLVGTRPPTPAQIPSDPAALAAAMRPPRRGEPLATHFRHSWTRLTAPGYADAHSETMDELVGQILRRPTPRAGVLAQSRAIAGWHGAHRLARIAAPTVVVHGDLDPIMPVGNGRRLARLIPDATYTELAGVGHLVPHEAGSKIVGLLSTLPVGLA